MWTGPPLSLDQVSDLVYMSDVQYFVNTGPIGRNMAHLEKTPALFENGNPCLHCHNYRESYINGSGGTSMAKAALESKLLSSDKEKNVYMKSLSDTSGKLKAAEDMIRNL